MKREGKELELSLVRFLNSVTSPLLAQLVTSYFVSSSAPPRSPGSSSPTSARWTRLIPEAATSARRHTPLPHRRASWRLRYGLLSACRTTERASAICRSGRWVFLGTRMRRRTSTRSERDSGCSVGSTCLLHHLAAMGNGPFGLLVVGKRTPRRRRDSCAGTAGLLGGRAFAAPLWGSGEAHQHGLRDFKHRS